jgi:L-aspartate oxidase
VRDRAGLSGLIDWIDTERRTGGPALALTAARLVASAALDRRESRGGHHRSDFPDARQPPAHTSIVPAPASSPHPLDFRVAAA